MIRVLQVLGSVSLGGAESRVMDIYRHMDRDKIQFDFLVTRGTQEYYNDEIKSMGGNIYYLPPFRIYNYFSYIKAVKAFFKEHSDYAAVHGHMTSTAAMYLPIAKKCGIPLTIAHARSAGVDAGLKGRLTKLLRRNLYKRCDVMIACSDLAGTAVFGRARQDSGKVIFMPNAIDSEAFTPNSKVRDEIRGKYSVADRFVIGHVGRFHYAKNHEFLLQIFSEICKVRQDAVLMLVGDGPLHEDIERWAEALGIKDRVIMTGRQTPVDPYYQAFDCMLFPSRYEGMPGTIVEAQAAGINCLVSDTVTSQVKISDMVEFMSLDKSATEWAEALLDIAGRDTTVPDIKSTNYDVNNQIKFYEELYGN